MTARPVNYNAQELVNLLKATLSTATIESPSPIPPVVESPSPISPVATLVAAPSPTVGYVPGVQVSTKQAIATIICLGHLSCDLH